MSCKFDDSFKARPSVPIALWKTPDDGQKNCPKHVEFLDKNKFGKISASVGFIENRCTEGSTVDEG
jgi:hypothetical protein